MVTPAENLVDYCAPGTTVEEGFFRVDSCVSLRVISFRRPHKSSFPPVVFVAGWISLIRGWQKVLREMTADIDVYYIETREKISSRIQGGVPQGVEQIGGDLVPLVEQLGLRDYVMFGSSLGATAVIDCYSRLKTKPRGMILVGPNAVFRVPLSWKIIVTMFYAPLYSLIRPLVKWYLRNFRLDVRVDAAQYEKYSEALDAAEPRKLKKAVMAVWSYEVWDKLASVDCPVLIVNASRDRLHEPENLRRIAAALPNATEVDLLTNAQTHDVAVVNALRSFVRNL